jgi:hypothetical protein
MSDKKQTALQWLLEQWPIIESQLPSYIINQALEMEREQIIDAYYYDPNCDEIKDDGELYYKETYGDHSVDANEMIDHIAEVRKMVGGQDESNH